MSRVDILDFECTAILIRDLAPHQQTEQHYKYLMYIQFRKRIRRGIKSRNFQLRRSWVINFTIVNKMDF